MKVAKLKQSHLAPQVGEQNLITIVTTSQVGLKEMIDILIGKRNEFLFFFNK